MRTPRFSPLSAAGLAVQVTLRRWAVACGGSVPAITVGALAGVSALLTGSLWLARWTEQQAVVAALGLPRLGIAALVLTGSVISAGLVAIVASHQAWQCVALPRTLGLLPATDREVGAALAAVPGLIATARLLVLLPLGAGLIATDAGVPWWRAALAFTAAELIGTSAGRALYAVIGAGLRRAPLARAANLVALALWCALATTMVLVLRTVSADPGVVNQGSWKALAVWPVLLGAVSGPSGGLLVALLVAVLAMGLDAGTLGLLARTRVASRPALEPRWLPMSEQARGLLFQVAFLRLVRNPSTRDQICANTLVLTGVLTVVLLTQEPGQSGLTQTGLRGSAFLAAQVAVASRGLWGRSLPYELVAGASLPAWVLSLWSASLAVGLLTAAPHAVAYASWAGDPGLLVATFALTVFTVSVGCLYSFVVVPGVELGSGLALGSFLVLLSITGGGAVLGELFSVADFVTGAALLAAASLLAVPAMVVCERRRFALPPTVTTESGT